MASIASAIISTPHFAALIVCASTLSSLVAMNSLNTRISISCVATTGLLFGNLQKRPSPTTSGQHSQNKLTNPQNCSDRFSGGRSTHRALQASLCPRSLPPWSPRLAWSLSVASCLAIRPTLDSTARAPPGTRRSKSARAGNWATFSTWLDRAYASGTALSLAYALSQIWFAGFYLGLVNLDTRFQGKQKRKKKKT